MQILFKITCALSLMLTLNACARMTGSGATETRIGEPEIQALGRAAFCDVAQPLRWSSTDTDETIKQAKLYNATGVSLCKWH